MTIKWPGDAMGDTQAFVQELFRKMSHPDEELLAILLFWREAKLAHVEALDDSHFVDDAAKSNLFERVVPRLIRERTPDFVGLAMHTRWRAGEDQREGVLVTVVGTDFIRMTRATVQRRAESPPVLEEWKPFPDSQDLEVESWINDALRAALLDSHSPRGLSRLFRRQ